MSLVLRLPIALNASMFYYVAGVIWTIIKNYCGLLFYLIFIDMISL